MNEADQRDVHHHRRIRRRARMLSWGFVPLSAIAALAWLSYSGFVCWNEHATPTEVAACRYAQVVPDTSALLITTALGALAFALIAFQEERFALVRQPQESLPLHYVRKVRAGYGQLDADHQASVWFALEMSAWSAVLMVFLLTFYFLEYSFPLGLLTVAASLRVLYGGARRMHKKLASPPVRPRPSGP